MNLNLSVDYRGHNLLLTFDAINIAHTPAEWDIGLSASAEFEVEEIYVSTDKGMRLPSPRVDEALHELLKGEYAGDIIEMIVNSRGEDG